MNTEVQIMMLNTQSGENLLAVKIPKFLKEKVEILDGRRWDPVNLYWKVPIHHLPKLELSFPQAVFSPGVIQYKENQTLRQLHLEKEFLELTNGVDLRQPLLNGKTLFDYQRTGVLLLLRNKRMILADDMGLGKTIQSLVAAMVLSQSYGWKIIIVSPVSVIQNWQREAEGLGISKMMVSTYTWAKIPEAPLKEFIFIADESHYAQNGNRTQRGKAFLELAKSSFCRACFCLTGTPMKNGQPINLFPLLQAVRHELAMNTHYFQVRYCKAHRQEIIKRNKEVISFWDNSGSSHLVELHEKIKPAMIRRTKKECLPFLPEKTRVMREATFAAEAKKSYQQALKELRDKYEAKVKAGIIVGDAEAMVMLGHLAHAGAIGKVEEAFEIAEEVLEEGNQVVLFSTYVDPLKILQRRFQERKIATELLIGETKDRQSLVDRFLGGESRVFLLSMAGGVGIDLYTASEIININRPWTPGDIDQIEDRLNRIGQKNAVTSFWLQYGEVDKHIDHILENKSKSIDIVLNGKGKRYNESSVGSYAKDYLESIL